MFMHSRVFSPGRMVALLAAGCAFGVPASAQVAAPSAPSRMLSFELEKGRLGGSAVVTTPPFVDIDASGGAYVTLSPSELPQADIPPGASAGKVYQFWGATSSRTLSQSALACVEFDADIPVAGTYTLILRYSNGGADPFNLWVGGTTAGYLSDYGLGRVFAGAYTSLRVPLAPTDSATSFSNAVIPNFQIPFTGKNTIRFGCESIGTANLDSIILIPEGSVDAYAYAVSGDFHLPPLNDPSQWPLSLAVPPASPVQAVDVNVDVPAGEYTLLLHAQSGSGDFNVWVGATYPGYRSDFGQGRIMPGYCFWKNATIPALPEGGYTTLAIPNYRIAHSGPNTLRIGSCTADGTLSFDSLTLVPTQRNLAGQAVARSSDNAGAASLAALNDGSTPASSMDTSHGSYVYPRGLGQDSWVEYDFDQSYTLSSSEVYWRNDLSAGVAFPQSYTLQYWTGTAWAGVQGTSGVRPATPGTGTRYNNGYGYVSAADVAGLFTDSDAFSATAFTPVKTNKVRLAIHNDGGADIGILEWRVLGEGATTPNIASKAVVRTSYVSPWESLKALNDGFEPLSSSDRSHAVYGNWSATNGGSTQWVEYDLDRPYTFTGTHVYWFADGEGIAAPASSSLLGWNGSAFDPTAISSPALGLDQYNVSEFLPRTTRKLRLQMTGQSQKSTGIEEWQVFAVPATNLALQGLVQTSYCSPWENTAAVNDGFDPSSSSDRSHAVYGNWQPGITDPRLDHVDLVFNAPVSVSECDIYWFQDNQGIMVPSYAHLEYWDGALNAFRPVLGVSGVGLSINHYNKVVFSPVVTSTLRLNMLSQAGFATGLLEWKVWERK